MHCGRDGGKFVVERLLAVSAAGYVIAFAGFAVWSRQRIRTALDAYDHNFLVCPTCRYDLRHLAERGKCPECGEPYRYEELPDIWRNELGEVEMPPEEIVRRVLAAPATEYENRRLQPGSGRLLPRDAKK